MKIFKKYPKLQKKEAISLDVETGKIFLIDTICFHNKYPEEFFETSLEEFLFKKPRLFSLHQVPPVDLLMDKFVTILGQASKILEEINPSPFYEIKKAFTIALKNLLKSVI